MGNAFVYECKCLDIFDMSAQGAADKQAGFENDLAETDIDFAALRRTQAKPLTDEESKMFGEIFKKLDKNHDNSVSRQELRDYFQAHFNPLMPAELEELMDIVDNDRSGNISIDEFKKFCQKMEFVSPAHVGIG